LLANGGGVDGYYGNISTTQDGLFTFVTAKSSATTIKFDSAGYMVTTNPAGWIANVNKGATFGTVYFNTQSQITSAGYNALVCSMNTSNCAITCTVNGANVMQNCGGYLRIGTAVQTANSCVQMTFQAQAI